MARSDGGAAEAGDHRPAGGTGEGLGSGTSCSVLAVAAASLLFLLIGLPLLSGTVYVEGDLGVLQIPWRSFYARCLKSGDSFAWMPQVYCGVYVHGEGEMGMFHPLHLFLYRLLPLGIAVNIELLANYLFGWLGALLWLRRWKLSSDAALFGALLLGFSGFQITHFMHLNRISVASHIPWLLLAIDVVLRGEGGRRRALAALFVSLLTASELLLGDPQTVWFSLVAESAYTIAVTLSATDRARRILSLASAKAIGLLMGGIQLLPTLDYYIGSARRHASLEFSYIDSVPPQHMARLLVPWLFGSPHEYGLYTGVVPLVLVVWLMIRRRETRFPRFLPAALAILSGFALVLALGKYGMLYRLLARVPLIGHMRCPNRYILLFHLAVGGLAAIAFADLSRVARHRERTPWRLLLPFTAPPLLATLALCGWALVQDTELAARLHHSVPLALLAMLPTAAATCLALAAARGFPAALAGLILLAAADATVYDLALLRGRQPLDIAGLAATTTVPPGPVRGRVWDSTTYNILMLRDLRLASGYSGFPPARQLREPTLSNLRASGVEWARGPAASTIHGGATGTADAEWARVPDPMPRVRMVTRAMRSIEPAEQVARVDLATTALVDSELDLEPASPGRAAVVLDRPGAISVATSAVSQQLLVLLESHHPGWTVRVDGVPHPLLRADGDFMGCLVEAGEHRVDFVFRPLSLRAGAWISALGVLLAAARVTGWSARRNRRA